MSEEINHDEHYDEDHDYNGYFDNVYDEHIVKEGNGPCNNHPDGCFYCGDHQHFSQDCPDKHLY